MSDEADKAALQHRVSELIDSSIGLDVFLRQNWLRWKTVASEDTKENYYASGIRMAAVYISIFFLAPWLIHGLNYPWFGKGTGLLYALQLYGGLWAGWATTTTGLAARALGRTINSDIIRYMSEAAVLATTAELRRRFRRPPFLVISWGLGIISAALAGVLINRDLHNQDMHSQVGPGEIVFWSAGWALLFATSAGVVNISRFYSAFAANLECDASKLFRINPARSSLLTSIASLGKTMLSFWLGIAISIALIIPISMIDWQSFPNIPLFRNKDDLSIDKNLFILVDVVVTSFFSIGVGTVVFLRSEASLRRAARISSESMLRAIEREVAPLTNRLYDLNEYNWRRLSALRDLHKDIALASAYRGALLSGVSILVPLIPLFSLLVKIILGLS